MSGDDSMEIKQIQESLFFTDDKGGLKLLPLVYICAPYAGDPEGNTERAKAFAWDILCTRAGAALMVVPHLLFQYMEEKYHREDIIILCCRLVASCNELVVCGPSRTSGMIREIETAMRCGVPVSYWDIKNTERRS